MTRLEKVREKRPRVYVFRQLIMVKKELGWALRTWSFNPADHGEPVGISPEEDLRALGELVLRMEEIERIAREVREFAAERMEGMRATDG